MGFRENLKAELTYADMKVKELAELSGVKKLTLDSYLRENGYIPSVETGVRIARALGVSVEKLVLGKETTRGKTLAGLDYDLRLLIRSIEELKREHRKIVVNNALYLIGSLKNRPAAR